VVTVIAPPAVELAVVVLSRSSVLEPAVVVEAPPADAAVLWLVPFDDGGSSPPQARQATRDSVR